MGLNIDSPECKAELFKFLYVLIFDIENKEIKEQLLNKLNNIKSSKSLEMILDICPFINKHATIEDTPLLLDDIINLHNNKENKKKLTLTIK